MNLLRYGLLLIGCILSAWQLSSWSTDAPTVKATSIEAEFSEAHIKSYSADAAPSNLRVDRIIQYTGKSELKLFNPRIETENFLATGSNATVSPDQNSWSIDRDAKVVDREGKYTLNAKVIEGQTEAKRIVATGEAEVRSANWHASADTIQYNQNNDTWRLEGEVRYEITPP